MDTFHSQQEENLQIHSGLDGRLILRLNVGCGRDPWGDVRLDISSAYLKGETNANIYADAQSLPFKDKVFEETKAHHILEHLPHWKKAILEWCRVTKRKIEIEVPIDPEFVNREIYAEILSGNFSYLLALPRRRKEHLWKFSLTQ